MNEIAESEIYTLIGNTKNNLDLYNINKPISDIGKELCLGLPFFMHSLGVMLCLACVKTAKYRFGTL